MRYWLVMPAAGAGHRFGAALPKQYAPLAGRTVIEWALAPFLQDARCVQAVVALAADDAHWPLIAARLARIAAPGAARGPQVTVAAGGAQRSLSVRSALGALAGRAAAADWVLVHDAARPCLMRADLDGLLRRLEAHPLGGLLAAPAADTLKRAQEGSDGVSEESVVTQTVGRAHLWRALTPQMFRYASLCEALDAAHAAGRFPSDEAQALEWSGGRPALVAGSATNLKITTADDLLLAAALLRSRDAAGGGAHDVS